MMKSASQRSKLSLETNISMEQSLEFQQMELDYLLHEINSANELREVLRRRVDQILTYWITCTAAILGATAAITTSQSIRPDTISVLLGVASLALVGIGLMTFVGAIGTRIAEQIQLMVLSQLRSHVASRFLFAKKTIRVVGNSSDLLAYSPTHKLPKEFIMFSVLLLCANTFIYTLGTNLCLGRIGNAVLLGLGINGFPLVTLNGYAFAIAIIGMVLLLIGQTFYLTKEVRRLKTQMSKLGQGVLVDKIE